MHNDLFDVYITPFALTKLNEYATAAQPNEIGGLARLEIEENTVYVIDVEMFPQSATPGSFDIKADDINAFTLRMIKEGRQDELSEWCSIVHSHPIGCPPNMSSVDVEAIKRFAQEEDAFSLIITASHNANSDNLLMHYCGNIKGRKIIASDMKVGIAFEQEQIDKSKKIEDYILKLYKNEGFDESEMKSLRNKVFDFVCDSIPTMSNASRSEIRDKARQDVKELVKNKLPKLPPARNKPYGWAPPAVEAMEASLAPYDDIYAECHLSEDDEIREGDSVLLVDSALDSMQSQLIEPEDLWRVIDMTEKPHTVTKVDHNGILVNGFLVWEDELVKVSSGNYEWTDMERYM